MRVYGSLRDQHTWLRFVTIVSLTGLWMLRSF